MDHLRVMWKASAASRSFSNSVRCVLGGERGLDELLGDRRAALHGLLGSDVLPQRAADAAQVDAVVGVEAAVLDRDDRVLHHRRDLALGQEDPALVAGQEPERLAVGGRRAREFGCDRRLLELGQVGRRRPSSSRTRSRPPRAGRGPPSSAITRSLRMLHRARGGSSPSAYSGRSGIDPRLAVFGDGGRVGGALGVHRRGRRGPRVPRLACLRPGGHSSIGADGRPPRRRSAAARNAVDCLPAGRSQRARWTRAGRCA